MYGASAADIWDIFGDYVSGNPSAIVLALGNNIPGEAAQNALDKTFASFGYGNDACAFATLSPQRGDGPQLDPQALFMLIEGLDPVCIVCVDEAATHAAENAYRTTCKLDSSVRIFGRPAAAFRDLNALVGSSEGKQKAWSVLKTLPRA